MYVFLLRRAIILIIFEKDSSGGRLEGKILGSSQTPLKHIHGPQFRSSLGDVCGYHQPHTTAEVRTGTVSILAHV